MSFPTKSQRIFDESNDTKSISNEKSFSAENPILLNGFQSIGQPVVARHPLEALERSSDQRMDYKNYLLLKSIQGIHSPLRLIHERRAALQVQRLPGLHSSNLMLDVLTGRDELIGPEDFLNDVSQPEGMAPIHTLCERKFNVL